MPYKNGVPAFKRSEHQTANQIRIHCKTKCRVVGSVKRAAADGTSRGTLPYDVLTKNGLRIEVKLCCGHRRPADAKPEDLGRAASVPRIDCGTF